MNFMKRAPRPWVERESRRCPRLRGSDRKKRWGSPRRFPMIKGGSNEGLRDNGTGALNSAEIEGDDVDGRAVAGSVGYPEVGCLCWREGGMK